MFWLAILALALLCALVIGVAVWRRRQAYPDRQAHDQAVYAEQLKEIDGDLAQGLINAEEAEQLRREIARRLLGSDADKPTTPTTPATGRPLIVLLLVVLPLAALGSYAALAPLPLTMLHDSQRFAIFAQPPEGAPDLETLVERLKERLQSGNDDDGRGWSLLARSYAQLGRLVEADGAFAEALRRDPEDIEAIIGRIEILVTRADGRMTEEAAALLQQAQAAAPERPDVRYFQGLAAVQAGDLEDGYQTWLALAQDTPADATWFGLLQQALSALAARIGRDVAQEWPAHFNAPAAGEPARDDAGAAAGIAALPPAERQEAIRGMVAGLAERLADNPDDIEGWTRLARSYMVLEDFDAAVEAYENLRRLQPQDTQIASLYARALIAATPPPEGANPGWLPEAAVNAYQQIHDTDPAHGEALFRLGAHAASQGRLDIAVTHWEALLQHLPKTAPQYDRLAEQVESMKARLGAEAE